MNICMVTTWGTACGIADYGEQLKLAVEAVDPSITLEPFSNLSPGAVLNCPKFDPDLLFLNHHDALHAAWTVEAVEEFKRRFGKPVVVVYHDTFSGEDRPNGEKARRLCEIADAFIVHEPVTDLPGAVLIRHGVPAIAAPWHSFPDSDPVLGTVGFNFPWKNYDRLAELTGEIGWALLLLANNATDEDEARWERMNPRLICVRRFLPQHEAISFLSGCDATVFAYECANAGTSGAIRQGLGARKPVLAFHGCRQFRDLLLADDAEAITWVRDWAHLRHTLIHEVEIQRVDPGVAYLAERDSWMRQGRKYAEVFRDVVAGGVK